MSPPLRNVLSLLSLPATRSVNGGENPATHLTATHCPLANSQIEFCVTGSEYFSVEKEEEEEGGRSPLGTISQHFHTRPKTCNFTEPEIQ